eukprot:gnl/TRDRNA2_/TRDRNA2_129952_c0_seq1.p1 gnl/TRDRNA2_/TRDRNA2_129952_c0~~gnl/TRDRNA2_/TRDRNA2_129952_c0_seq1.p1  ORF type:complete len:512 (-),score=78.06 gnl/TRDRNA2_/TRDRNA2_129952_c0_seq1:22-1557(-)
MVKLVKKKTMCRLQKGMATKRPRQPRGLLKAQAASVRLHAPRAPVGRPWPLKKLVSGHFQDDMSFGPLLKDVLKARGWKPGGLPCHSEAVKADRWEGDGVTVFVKEFVAALKRQRPTRVFGKRGSVQEGYRLKSVRLPTHALWMLSRTAYRVPGTASGKHVHREDFAIALVQHGANLPGDIGNFRICKFPGMETALWKANLAWAFRDKSWFPICYVLPAEKKALLADIAARGSSRNNLWIAKPNNKSGGEGIRVSRGTDPSLQKMIRESDGAGRQVVQHYLADPFLIGGYKFHMRVHMAITCLNPPEAFVQRNGQCLFATEPYTLSESKLGENFSPPTHVTNMCLNATEANKDNYFRRKPVIGTGQQFRIRYLEKYLSKHHPSYDEKDLWRQVVRIAAEVVRYIAKAPTVRQYGKLLPDRHFEVFGMDLMLDKDLNVYMCEVNTEPGLDYPDKKILGEPNPDYAKEKSLAGDTWHDLFTLLGLDAARKQTQGSLKHWFKVDFAQSGVDEHN